MNRGGLFLLVLVIGVGMAVAGFLLSAPIGPTENPTYSDPRMPFAPLVFVLGVILSFCSAIVYEVARDR